MIKAAIFDVFGTCVDWRNSVARAVREAVDGVDPYEFTDAWRAEYEPSMRKIRTGNRGYLPLDHLHHENLQIILERFEASVSDPEKLNRAWEKLDPWSDVTPGLNMLKSKVIIAPCSNGSIALMTHLAKYAGLPWDCILGAELAQNYKPHPDVYHACAKALQLAPADIVMVAAHNGDLAAAQAEGFKTAFICRPTEHGPDQTTDLKPEGDWDFIENSFDDLGQKILQQTA
ncbi:MAG: haloacid dehalogenase type II [Pseudomonadota bacterium]